MTEKKVVKGWKNCGKDLKCINFQFVIGGSYHQDGEISLCDNGFHFHESSIDIYKYYDRKKSIVVEVEATGKIITGDDKSVCSDIKIVRILSDDEIKKLCNLVNNTGLHNSGDNNSGDWNSGDWNSGDWNSGDWNSGYRNSGDRNSGLHNSGYRNSGYRNSGLHNSGDRNSGDNNSGDRNSGDRNSGLHNSGYRNSGDRNSGDNNSGEWNSGDWNCCCHETGCFNTKTPKKIMVFNKPCNRKKWDSAQKPDFLFFGITKWISESNMTDQEKIDRPEFYCQEGYLKTINYKDAFRESFKNREPGEFELLEKLPNFDWKVFTKISGIKKPK